MESMSILTEKNSFNENEYESACASKIGGIINKSTKNGGSNNKQVIKQSLLDHQIFPETEKVSNNGGDVNNNGNGAAIKVNNDNRMTQKLLLLQKITEACNSGLQGEAK